MKLGVLPFDSQFHEEIIKNIQECKYEFDQDVWNTVSADAKDLVSKLLQKDPAERIHLQDAMIHPWITVY
jgi:serine/threonine protein kinase